MVALCPICIRTLADEAWEKDLGIFIVHDLILWPWENPCPTRSSSPLIKA